MPRTTRNSAKKARNSKPTREPEDNGGSPKMEQDESSSRKSSGTPSRLQPSPSPNPSSTTPANGFTTPKASPSVAVKVAGSRLSGVKHSGLLAKDAEMRSQFQEAMDERDQIGLDMNFSLSTPGEDPSNDDYPSISGKELYMFRGQKQPPRSASKESRQTVSKAAETVSSPENGTPLPKKRKVTKTKPQRNKFVKDKEDNGEEEMEVDKKERDVRQKKRTRGGRQILESDTELEEVRKKERDDKQKKKTRGGRQTVESESESELSNLSDEEELTSLAAKLNRSRVTEIMSEDTLEDYFTAHSSKATTTSDHTLSKLACPRLDQQSVQSALEAKPSSFHSECQSLYEEYTNLYPYWIFQMSNGFNILLYGLGSKKKLLEDFRTEYLSDAHHLVVNGFFPGLTIKQVLVKLSSELLGHTGTFKSTTEHAQFICKVLEAGENGEKSSDGCVIPDELFLIIHNIDGLMLRGESVQSVLSILAQSPSIRVLASVDHINAPLMWDQKKLSRFNWLWHDVTTYELYKEETSYENSLLVRQSGNLALSSLINVTKSLTPNARGIFELLARYQLEHKEEAGGTYLGMSFQDCYMKCREKFLVNSDLTLRAQLTEFIDHKLVRSRKGQDGVEYLFVPVDEAVLSEFLEQNIDE